MKRFLMVISVMIMLFSTSLTVSANDREVIMSGYTDSGIYYEVYGITDNSVYGLRNTIAVERVVVFYGRVTPEATMNWSEKIGNRTYSGTLKLYSYNYSVADQITTAYYRGNLSSE